MKEIFTSEYSGSESTDLFLYFFLMNVVFFMQVTGGQGEFSNRSTWDTEIVTLMEPKVKMKCSV